MLLSEALPGVRNNRLVIVGHAVLTIKGKRRTMLEVQCDCGNAKKILPGNFEKTYSCGCLNAEKARATGKLYGTTHGMKGTTTYNIWNGLIQRCFNPNNKDYHRYGSRAPDYAWRDFNTFLKDMGECPKGFSIERRDNRMPYSKENCVWIPKNQQQRNQSNTRWVLYEGVKVRFKDLTLSLGINLGTANTRDRKGWPISKVLGVAAQWCEAPTLDELNQLALLDTPGMASPTTRI